MLIQNHQLQSDNVSYCSSPNQGPDFETGLPDCIILHYTAMDSTESAVELLCDPKKKVSAHIVVGRDGSICQLVPFAQQAWHAGKSRYGQRSGFNQYAIGIEMDNAGKLEFVGGKYCSSFGVPYPYEEIVECQKKNESETSRWNRYSPIQINLVKDICALLIRAYSISSIYGHEEIAPDRKIDPGPAFPLNQLREELLGRKIK